MTSVFASYQQKAWPWRFEGALHVATIAGGIPTDEHVAESWLRTKLADKDDLIREAVAKTMVERNIGADEAAKEVDTLKHLNGFKRDDRGLYVEGRQLKACLKEAVSVAVAAGKWPDGNWRSIGDTRKWLTNYFPEHVFVVEDRLHLGVTEPTGVMQRFVHTHRGTGIQYEEYVQDAKIAFTVITDHDFTGDQWALLWCTAEQNGLGASRSQGYGRFEVTKWDLVTEVAKKRKAKAVA